MMKRQALRIRNTNMNEDQKRLVIERDSSGNITAEVLPDIYIGFPFSVQGSVERAVANIVPTKPQLHAIVAALKIGAVKLSDLDGVGGLYGGMSNIDIPVSRLKDA